MKTGILLCAAGFLLMLGCGGKSAATPEDLKAAFEKPASGGASLSNTPPEIKVWVDHAVTAMKNDDQATAVMSLRSLRASGQLTYDQAMAVEDMMIQARATLAERAARGDQQAIAALQMLNMNPR